MTRQQASVALVSALVGLVLLVLIAFQTFGLRDDLAETRSEVEVARQEANDTRQAIDELGGRIDALERGVPLSELSLRLGEIENEIRRWVVAFSGEIDPDAAGGGDSAAVLERLEVVLDQIAALNERLDQICAGVPVC